MSRSLLLSCILSVSLAAFGCDESEEGAAEEATEEATGSAEQGEEAAAGGEQALGEMSGEELGEATGARFVEGLEELAQLTDGNPPPEQIRGDVEALKESVVTDMVAYGRAREQLDDSEKSAFDRELRSAIRGAANNPAFQKMADAANHYNSVDTELGRLISDFNVITQYAQFELLRQQNPEEAERLGVAG